MVSDRVVEHSRGRPRSPLIRTLIAESVLDLVGDGATLNSLSMVAVAQRAGVSRNSMYRRWPSKDDLYGYVLGSISRPLPTLSVGSAREGVAQLLNFLAGGVAELRVRRFLIAVIAEAPTFPALYELYVRERVEPVELALRVVIRRGKETREIRVDVDEDLLVYLLVSSVMALAPNAGDRLHESALLANRVTDLVFDGAALQ